MGNYVSPAIIKRHIMTEKELRDLSVEELSKRFNIAKLSSIENGNTLKEYLKKHPHLIIEASRKGADAVRDKAENDTTFRESFSKHFKDQWEVNRKNMSKGQKLAVIASKKKAKDNPEEAMKQSINANLINTANSRERRRIIIKDIYKFLGDKREFKRKDVREVFESHGYDWYKKQKAMDTILLDAEYFTKVGFGLFKRSKNKFE